MMTGKCEPDSLPVVIPVASETSSTGIHDNNNNASSAATPSPVTATVHPFSKREPIVTSSSLIFSQSSNQKDGKRVIHNFFYHYNLQSIIPIIYLNRLIDFYYLRSFKTILVSRYRLFGELFEVIQQYPLRIFFDTLVHNNIPR